MAAEQGHAQPDFRWLTALHATACGVAVVAAMVFSFSSMERSTPATFAALGALLTALFAGAALWMQRRSSGTTVAGVLAMGSACMAWMLGAGLRGLLMGARTVWPEWSSGRATATERPMIYAFGAATVLVVGLALASGRKLAAAMAPVGLAFLLGISALFESSARAEGNSFSDSAQGTVFVLGALALVGLAKLWEQLERARAWRTDGAAWLHFVALFLCGIGMAMHAGSRGTGEFVAYAVLSGSLVLLGRAWQRSAYYLAAAAGVMLFPALALVSSHAPTEVLLGWIALVTVGIAVAAGWLRRELSRDWREGKARALDERSVWAAP